MKKGLLVSLCFVLSLFLITAVVMADEEVADETIILRGAGADIWAETNSFQFVYKEVEGDVDIIAKVVDYQVGDWTNKYGVMIKSGLNAADPQASIFPFLMMPDEEIMVELHAQTGRGYGSSGKATAVLPHAQKPPVWIRLRREGDTISAFYSVEEDPDHFDWYRFGNTHLENTADTVYVGLIAAELGSGGFAEFSDISINEEPVYFDDWDDNIGVGTSQVGEMEKGTLE